MPDVIQFGPFMIRAAWLMLGLSGVAGYLCLKHRIRYVENADQEWPGILLNALFLFILAWRLSPLLFPSHWDQLGELLFSNGTLEGIWIGTGVVLVYLLVKWRVKKLNLWVAADLVGVGILSSAMIYNLLFWQYGNPTTLLWGITIQDPEYKYHPVNVYRLVLWIPLFLWLWKQNPQDLGKGKWFTHFLVYFGLSLLFVSFFEPTTKNFFFFSMKQAMYIAMVCGGVFIGHFLSRNKQKDIPADTLDENNPSL